MDDQWPLSKAMILFEGGRLFPIIAGNFRKGIGADQNLKQFTGSVARGLPANWVIVVFFSILTVASISSLVNDI